MIPDPEVFPGAVCTVVNRRRIRNGRAVIEEGIVTSATYYALSRTTGKWSYRVVMTRKSRTGGRVYVLIRERFDIRAGGMTDEERGDSHGP